MIPQFKRILYTTDLSKNASYAFFYAMDMARRYNASIVILHSIERIRHMYGQRVEAILQKTKDHERKTDSKEIKKDLQEFCQRTETQIGAPCVKLVSKILVPLGHPVEEILKAADEESCDAIVLGTHGKGFLRQTFLGSVAGSVLERTRKPVFIIPLPSEKPILIGIKSDREKEENVIPQIRNILYATDLSKNSNYAFFYAVDMAKRHNATIVILHSVAHVRYIYSEGESDRVGEILREAKKDELVEDLGEIKKSLQGFCQRAETHIGEPCAELVSKILVPLGHPVEEILKAADEESCDAIVLGTHGKGFLRQTFLGSVAGSVLERTRKPVFIIPLPSEKTNIDWDNI